MLSESPIRILDDAALDGPTNMARDEVLLNFVGQGLSPPTLRLYEWDPPTISLGYFQPYTMYEELPAPAGELPVVRRTTGGGAILHDQELTYSFSLPVGHHFIKGKPSCLYDLMHRAVILSLADLGVTAQRCGETDDSGPARGPFFCFARRHEADVLVGQEKIAGSAQRRTRDAVLQHGSIVVGNRYAQQPTAEVDLPLNEVITKLRTLLADRIAQSIETVMQPGAWTSVELAAVEATRTKYDGDEWTRRC